MIVYRSAEHPADPRLRLEALAADLERWRNRPPEHEAVIAALIDFGVTEAAVLDAVCPEADAVHPLGKAFRQVGRLLGHVVWHSWRRNPDRLALWGSALRCEVRDLLAQTLPAEVAVRVPEGYAYYGLHPEAYLEAAVDFVRASAPRGVVCLGIRSIGTGLSSVVEAAVREQGIEAVSYTIRPHGHPYDRRPRLAPGLAKALAARPERSCLIVDEGPGLSGSSMAGTAQLLTELGIPEEHIVFFPSWQTDGSRLRSDLARCRWPRHRQFVVPFARVRASAGAFGRSGGECLDLSAGQWRMLLLPDESSWPAVQPQHERRKFLARDADHPAVLRRFVGLGGYGRPLLERARHLHAAGFVPEPLELADGFLASRWVEGTPLSPLGAARDPALLETAVRYLAFLYESCPGRRTVSTGELLRMIRVNVGEGLGDEWRDLLEFHPAFRQPAVSDEVTAVDARMQPHEWIRTGSGFLKTDALDHHADHFLPGCQDIAWDLAGCAVEFRLDAAGREALCRRFQRATDSGDLGQRLRFHTLAYLAFRLGYVTLAAEALEGTPDGCRFSAEAERYCGLLRQELAERRQGLWAS